MCMILRWLSLSQQAFRTLLKIITLVEQGGAWGVHGKQ